MIVAIPEVVELVPPTLEAAERYLAEVYLTDMATLEGLELLAAEAALTLDELIGAILAAALAIAALAAILSMGDTEAQKQEKLRQEEEVRRRRRLAICMRLSTGIIEAFRIKVLNEDYIQHALETDPAEKRKRREFKSRK